MPSPQVIDVEKLLAPIREDQPSGDELSIADLSGPLHLTKDSWDEARKLVKEQAEKERNGGIDSHGQPWRDVPRPDWDPVIGRATNLLANHSKDFRAASWLTEALLRKHHAAGLRDGLQICWGLCEKYWNSIHPLVTDEDGHGTTVGQFSGLVGEASFPTLLQIVVVKGRKEKERDERIYTAAQYERAKDPTAAATQEAAVPAQVTKIVLLSDIMALAAVTDKAFYVTLIEDLKISIELLKKLGDFFRENCRKDQYDEETIPPVTPFREHVEKLLKLVAEIRGEEALGSGESAKEGGDAASGEGGSAAGGMTRQSAFHTIERLAQFFERTEPHSPVSFVLRQAVRWGKMPLPELLNELIEDHGTMTNLRKWVGLPEPKREE